MKPKFFPVLDMCIENGIKLGYNRAHKHTETPTREQIEIQIYDAIMHEIYEWFEFPDDHEEDWK